MLQEIRFIRQTRRQIFSLETFRLSQRRLSRRRSFCQGRASTPKGVREGQSEAHPRHTRGSGRASDDVKKMQALGGVIFS